jgi:UDP-N-acetylmuramate dehydrogenase
VTADPVAVARALDLLGPLARADAPLGEHTTYRVGGPAAVAATVTDLADVARVAAAVVATELPVLVIGRGSNLLVADAGFPGIAVLVPGRSGDEGGVFTGVRFEEPAAGGGASPAMGGTPIAGADDEEDAGPPLPGASGPPVDVVAGAGVPLPTLARRCARAGVRGLEWSVGVPGSVGGGVRMNAGGHGADMAASLRWARVADLAAPPLDEVTPVVTERGLGELAYGYRRSSVGPTDLVVDARFGAVRGDPAEAEAQISGIVRWRREHQPGGQNAGSVFTNPPGDSAGRLIDAAGLKGLRSGSAEVSPKHANFIQADPGGSADDVRRLIDEVRGAVLAHSGIELHTEIRMIGFPADISPGQPSPST